MTIEERKALKEIATALTRLATVAEKFYDAAHPQYTGTENAEIHRVGQSAPEPQTPEEYASFPSDQPGRFTQLLRAAPRP